MLKHQIMEFFETIACLLIVVSVGMLCAVGFSILFIR